MIDKKYFPQLDALRGLCALAVVLYHQFKGSGFGIFSGAQTYDHPVFIPNFYLNHYGFYGVQVFFFISGFVMLLTAEKITDVRVFACKRFLRLFPLYWMALFLLMVVSLVVGHDINLLSLLINITMLQSIIGEFLPNGMGRDLLYVSWTLGVEIVFYFWIAFWILIKKRVSFDVILSALLMAGIASQLLIIGILEALVMANYMSYFAMGYVVFSSIQGKFSKLSMLTVILSVLLLYLVKDSNTFICSLMLFGLFWLVAEYDVFKLSKSSTLVYLGKVSYAVYLLHPPVGAFVQQYVYSIGGGIFVAGFLCVFATMMASHVVTFYADPFIRNALKPGCYKLLRLK